MYTLFKITCTWFLLQICWNMTASFLTCTWPVAIIFAKDFSIAKQIGKHNYPTHMHKVVTWLVCLSVCLSLRQTPGALLSPKPANLLGLGQTAFFLWKLFRKAHGHHKQHLLVILCCHSCNLLFHKPFVVIMDLEGSDNNLLMFLNNRWLKSKEYKLLRKVWWLHVDFCTSLILR